MKRIKLTWRNTPFEYGTKNSHVNLRKGINLGAATAASGHAASPTYLGTPRYPSQVPTSAPQTDPKRPQPRVSPMAQDSTGRHRSEYQPSQNAAPSKVLSSDCRPYQPSAALAPIHAAPHAPPAEPAQRYKANFVADHDETARRPLRSRSGHTASTSTSSHGHGARPPSRYQLARYLWKLENSGSESTQASRSRTTAEPGCYHDQLESWNSVFGPLSVSYRGQVERLELFSAGQLSLNPNIH
eukprot:2454318-Rhodomonas_salina.1